MLPRSKLKKALDYFNRGEYRKACREFEAFKSGADGFRGLEQEMVRM